MNTRSAQVLAATLAFLLIVLVGALIFILLSRPAPSPRPSPSTSPTTVAIVTGSPLSTLSPSLFPSTSAGASPTEIPTISLEPFPTPSPTPTAEITPEITPEVTPAITPSPTPTIAITPSPTPTITLQPTPTAPPIPTSPGRRIRLQGMGLDARNEIGIERYLIFGVDGPSLIRAQISSATGRVRMCLWQGNEVEDRVCRSMGNGVLEQPVFDAGSTSWTLTLISANGTTTPTLDLALDFNAISPSVDLENFRFQGTPVPFYNGMDVVIDALADGSLDIMGVFDPGQTHSYRVEIYLTGGENIYDAGGEAHSFTVNQAVTAATSYNVIVTNPNEEAEPTAVFIRVTFNWP